MRGERKEEREREREDGTNKKAEVSRNKYRCVIDS